MVLSVGANPINTSKERPMKTIAFALSATALASLALINPAQASCYGSGYGRVCDGNGGYGATYSNRGSEGRTTYYNNGGYSRTETYRSTPSFGGGYSTYGSTYR
jgi:hypothetical protein